MVTCPDLKFGRSRDEAGAAFGVSGTTGQNRVKRPWDATEAQTARKSTRGKKTQQRARPGLADGVKDRERMATACKRPGECR